MTSIDRKLARACSVWIVTLLLAGLAQAGGVKEMDAEVAVERLKAGPPLLFLDVRSPAEYAQGHIPGALNIPHTEVAARLPEIRSALEAAGGQGEILLFCERGGRARLAAEALLAAGLGDLHHLRGDMRYWRRGRYPTVSGADRGAPERGPSTTEPTDSAKP